MVEYILLFFFVLCVFTNFGKSKLYQFVLLCILCLLIGFRSIYVGTDTYYYSQTFGSLTVSEDSRFSFVNFDIGYYYLCYYFKSYISTNPMDLFGAMGVCYVLSFYFFLRKYANDYIGIGISFFVLYGTYFLGYNIMRQCFAISLFLLLCTFVDITKMDLKRTIISVIITGLISYLFHSVCYIFIVLLLISHKTIMGLFSKRIYVILILGTYVLFLLGIAVDFAFKFLGNTTMDSSFIHYLQRINNDTSGYSVLKLTLVNGLLLYSVYVTKTVQNTFLLYAVGGVMFLNLFGGLVIEFIRVYECIMTVGLIYYVNLFSEQRRWYKLIVVALLSLFYINIIYKGYGGIIPYEFR